jgi:hypothetical protein
MAIDFPASPTVGQIHPTTPVAGVPTYTWDGEKWTAGINNTGSVFTIIRVQKFVASGTYTPHANMVCCTIEVVGGGGGGGGALGSSGFATGGGGGGAGGYSSTIKTRAQVGASQVVTVGAAGAAGVSNSMNGGSGGATSVGTLCTAGGGSGGVSGSSGVIGAAGAGGAAGTGDISFIGASGKDAMYSANYTTAGYIIGTSWGGDSRFGSGGRAAPGAGGVAYHGVSATGNGAGGGGATAPSAAASAVNGGAGSVGLALITEFCSA